MNLFDVLKNHGIKINFVGIIAVLVILLIAITCIFRKPADDTKTPVKTQTTATDSAKTNKVETEQPKNKPVADEKYTGSNKIFKNYKYVGNSQSKVYHVTNGSCPVADKINPKNIVKLGSKEQARKLGYERCEICKP